jgi:hypothetical protein
MTTPNGGAPIFRGLGVDLGTLRYRRQHGLNDDGSRPEPETDDAEHTPLGHPSNPVTLTGYTLEGTR